MFHAQRKFHASLLMLLLMTAVAMAERPELQQIKVNFQPGAEYADEVRMFQGIPGLARAPGGRLWAVWYGGGETECKENYVMLVTSGDDGKTWSKLQAVLDPAPETVRAFDPVPWLDPDGRLWLFWGQAEAHVNNAATWAITTDNPDDEKPTWSKPRRLFNGIMMNKPTVLDDGSWLFPAAEWFGENSCHVVKSVDKGWSFELIGQANVPKEQRNCDEPMIVQRKNDLWLLVRTNYGIGQSISTDGGKTWSEAVETGIPHTAARFFIRRLASGNLLLVKHGPMDSKTGRSHLMAFLSKDDGKTWEGGLLLDERNSVSYPDGVQAPDGTIYIIYDFNRMGTKTIHMATFTEEDVLVGKDVSGKVRKRVLINQATGVNPQLNPKPKKSFTFEDNKDGVEFHQEAKAKLEAESGVLASDTFKKSSNLFADRFYTALEVPKQLEGKRFFCSSINAVAVRCTEPGTVWVVSPSKGRNTDSLADSLVEKGFQKVNLPEFMLFGDIVGNICSVYQKDLKKGDVLKLGKWGVVVY